MWSLSDESLLAGLASGDGDCVAAFVRRFQGRVYGLALRLTGDPQTADEVAQETFIRAWRHAGGYDPRRGRVITWLLTIARNVASDTRRLRRYEPIDPDVILMLPISDSEPGPEEQALTAAESERLREAIFELPEEQRRAVVLAGFHGRTAREISESEGIPVGTAKTRIRSGMLKLRSALEVEDER